MKKWTFILIFFIICIPGSPQETSYTGLKSKGAIPDDFTTLTTQKVEAAKEQMEGKDKAKSKFYEVSNFGVDKLLQSGSVCFNDTISSYVDDVLEEIRSANPSIPINIRIYAVKSPVVNAFTTDQGIIFINTGLLAQLENEAQLAFVLCHEIIHYTEGHVMEGFIENTEINNKKNDYLRTKSIDKELSSTRFSRKLEKEADKEGLKLFLNTDYNPQEVDGVFDVLLYSYLPFDEIPFDSSILEVGDYQIPDKYFLTELNEIEVDEDEDDSRHTHPNIAKRRKRADEILLKEKQVGKNFIVSENDFYAVRAAARYEVLRLQLINGNYSEALYSAFILNKEFPNNPLPQLAIGEILYGTALFANDNSKKEVTGYYKKKQGNVQQCYYLLNKLKSKEITLLAARYTYMLQEKYPNDYLVKKRLESLFTELVYHHELDDSKLNYTTVSEQKIDSSNTQVKQVNSKYDRIKSQKKSTSKKNDNKNWSLDIFAGCNCESEVTDLFEEATEKSDKLKLQRGETDDLALNKASKKRNEKYQKLKRKKGRSLEIPKIVMIDPYYIVFDQLSKKDNLKLVKSEKEEVEQINELESMASEAHLKIDILSNYKFETSDVDQFNDFSLMKEWVSERYLMGDKTTITSSAEEVQNLIEKYDTKYFAYTGVVSTNKTRRKKFGTALLYGCTIIGLPYSLYYLFTDQKVTLIYFALFDIESGDLVMYEERELWEKDSNGLLKSHYSDMFNQITRK